MPGHHQHQSYYTSFAVRPLNNGLSAAEAVGDFMLSRLSFLSIMMLSIVGTVWLSGLPVLAAPSNATITFTPPLAQAKTIQVTEVMWKGRGTVNSPFQRDKTIKFCIERPDKFRVDMKLDSVSAGANNYFVTFISDGHTLTTYGHGPDGYQLYSELLNPKFGTIPGEIVSLIRDSLAIPVSGTPAIREGKQVLLVIDKTPSTIETWYDPKTHLPIRMVGFATWKGKRVEWSRFEYQGWLLDEPLTATVFSVPSTWTSHK